MKTQTMQKILFPLIFFISGFTTMVFELLGSRILAPYIGNSLMTWTGIIGIILLFLSLGYYVGGVFSHKNYLWEIFFIVSVSFFFLALFKDNILPFFIDTHFSHITKIILSSIALFSIPSFFIASLSPFLMKEVIKNKSEKEKGKKIGIMYMLSTLGSIIGTFATGFLLIPFLGIYALLISLALIYLFLSLFFIENKKIIIPTILILFVYVIFLLFPNLIYQSDKTTLFSKETAYGLLTVKDVQVQNKKIRRLYIDNLVHSEIFLDKDKNDETISPFFYIYYYNLADYINKNLQDTLMIGGGAYAYPQYFLRHHTKARMDVVEINPEVTRLAKKYFGLKESPRLHIFHEDGRVFLQETDKKYDAIFIDAFHGFTIPAQLTSLEFIQLLYDHLHENGVVIVNVPGNIDGEGSQFLKAEYATYKKVFPFVDLFLTHKDHKEVFQNIMLVAQKSKKQILDGYHEGYFKYYQLLKRRFKNISLGDRVSILTDDYNPVDFYTRNFDAFH